MKSSTTKLFYRRIIKRHDKLVSTCSILPDRPDCFGAVSHLPLPRSPGFPILAETRQGRIKKATPCHLWKNFTRPGSSSPSLELTSGFWSQSSTVTHLSEQLTLPSFVFSSPPLLSWISENRGETHPRSSRSLASPSMPWPPWLIGQVFQSAQLMPQPLPGYFCHTSRWLTSTLPPLLSVQRVVLACSSTCSASPRNCSRPAASIFGVLLTNCGMRSSFQVYYRPH